MGLAAGTAGASVLTFESSAGTFLNPGDAVAEQGYSVTLTGDENAFGLVADASAGLISNGSNTLELYNTVRVLLTSDTGAPFDLTSFDVAGTFAGSSRNPTSLALLETFVDGTTSLSTLNLDNPDVFNTLTLPNFTGLTSVAFYGASGVDPLCENCPEFQLDNITVQPTSVSVGGITSAPEPGTALMLALGAACWLPLQIFKLSKCRDTRRNQD